MGPGLGEGFCVRIPGFGWLLCDSVCPVKPERLTEEAFPASSLNSIYQRWADNEEIRYWVWSHPHADHCQGVPELLETLLRLPQAARCQAILPGGELNSWSFSQWKDLLSDPARVTLAQNVMASLQAVDSFAAVDESRVRLTRAGEYLVDTPDLRIRVLSPAAARVEHFLGAKKPDLKPNMLSTVLRLSWGTAFAAFCGDLEDKDEAWEQVLKLEREFSNADLLKVPHHGSHTAFHKGWNTPKDGSVVWVGTPKNSGESAPPTHPDIGQLVQRHQPVHWTSPPAWLKVPPEAFAGQVSVKSLEAPENMIGGQVRRVIAKPDPLRFVWAFVRETEGWQCYRGKGALRFAV